MIKKSSGLLTLLMLVGHLAFCTRMQAQSGCVNSPENPTAVLALVGAAGILVTRLRGRA